MKRTPIPAVLALLGLSFACAPHTSEPAKDHRLLPLSLGNSWTYVDQRGIESVDEVVSSRLINDDVVFHIQGGPLGELLRGNPVYSDEDRLYVYNVNRSLTPPEEFLVFDLSAEPGATWQSPWGRVERLDDRTVETPAGKFAPVAMFCTGCNTADGRTEFGLVPGVGFVVQDRIWFAPNTFDLIEISLREDSD
ncbi:MAG: hypothetical protein HKN21_11080 [Candidatus Eisenbacteria bacterium]|uniref:Uncharacterized protein n=1 Tax=Eiseniibacteriota bacterium TaxID=2212470 RepID=A0A7Y2E8R3_UNCEI|nr:hypothetical protein [Candidatus Eisenbacteria bacterium]